MDNTAHNLSISTTLAAQRKIKNLRAFMKFQWNRRLQWGKYFDNFQHDLGKWIKVTPYADLSSHRSNWWWTYLCWGPTWRYSFCNPRRWKSASGIHYILQWSRTFMGACMDGDCRRLRSIRCRSDSCLRRNYWELSCINRSLKVAYAHKRKLSWLVLVYQRRDQARELWIYPLFCYLQCI